MQAWLLRTVSLAIKKPEKKILWKTWSFKRKYIFPNSDYREEKIKKTVPQTFPIAGKLSVLGFFLKKNIKKIWTGESTCFKPCEYKLCKLLCKKRKYRSISWLVFVKFILKMLILGLSFFCKSFCFVFKPRRGWAGLTSIWSSWMQKSVKIQ